MKRFTDEQIIKALKCCIAQENCEEVSCEICPYNKVYDCKEVMLKNALDIFNRQKTEIKRLEKESLDKEKTYNNEYFLRKEIEDELKDYKAENKRLLQKLQQAKSEAIKEFAERLKRCIRFDDKCEYNSAKRIVGFINYLIKEMTEDNNEH